MLIKPHKDTSHCIVNKTYLLYNDLKTIYMQYVHVDTDARVMYAALIGVSLT